jgi:hypothetical protein
MASEAAGAQVAPPPLETAAAMAERRRQQAAADLEYHLGVERELRERLAAVQQQEQDEQLQLQAAAAGEGVLPLVEPSQGSAAAPSDVLTELTAGSERTVLMSSNGPVPFPGIPQLPPRQAPEAGQVLLRYDVEAVRGRGGGEGAGAGAGAGAVRRSGPCAERAGAASCSAPLLR